MQKKHRLISKSLVIEKVQKKIVPPKMSNSMHHNFGGQHSETASQASQLGLKYLGFGRYGDDKGAVTHIVQNKRLVQVQDKKEGVGVKYDDSHIHKDFQKFAKGIKPFETKEHPPEVKKIIDRYYNDRNKFALINNHLSTKKDGDEDDYHMKRRIKALDKLTRSYTLKKDTVFYSGGKGTKEEGIYTTKGYRACTLDIGSLMNHTNDIIEIHAKAGKKALFINNRELVLPRNHDLRIIGAPIKTKTHTIWKAELV